MVYSLAGSDVIRVIGPTNMDHEPSDPLPPKGFKARAIFIDVEGLDIKNGGHCPISTEPTFLYPRRAKNELKESATQWNVSSPISCSGQ